MPKEEPLPSSFETSIRLDGTEYQITFGVTSDLLPYRIELSDTDNKVRDLEEFTNDEISRILAACYAELERWR